MNIGEVLARLRPEFPDVTISKIRFLEEQGLVTPERTAAGYRKFDHHDLERLRYVLTVQRDHYLPLRVIREHLDALDRGLEPPLLHGLGPQSPRLVRQGEGAAREADQPAPAEMRLDRRQFLQACGIDGQLLRALESFGLVTSRASGFDADAVVIARTAGELAAFGVEPRHLRAFRTGADREAGLVEQVVAPLRRQRGAESAARAEETARELAALCVRLHAALVKSAIDRGGA
jgi:DNA-binding transcriptional MerR regulator